MVQERNAGSENVRGKLEVKTNTPEEWFKMACYLASRGKQGEAELAIMNALNIRDEFPIAWAILSAILLSKGKETDAEQAGKKAISQCKSLAMTWPKMRGIIFSKGIIRGASWKDPRRVVIEDSDSSDWGKLLETLGKASEQDITEISSDQETLDDTDESQAEAHSSKEYTPTREIQQIEKKEYKSARSQSGRSRDHEVKKDTEVDSSREYTPKRRSDVIRPRYQSAESRFESPQQHTASKQVDDAQASSLFITANALLKKGNLDGAEDAFIKALKLDPSNGEAWLKVSSILMGKRKFEEAIGALKQATEKMPKNAAAWYQLGYCYQKLNKWSDAVPPLKQATILDKQKPDFWMALGLSEFHMGQFQFSAKSLLRVLRMSPNHKKALFYLAMCMEKQGNRKHSLSLYLKLLNLGALKPGMLNRMAGAFERLNRPREARECRRQAQYALSRGVR